MKYPLFALAVCFAIHLPVRGIIIGSAVDNGDGTHTYQYTIDNSAGNFDVIGFTLEFPLRQDQIDWDPLDIFAGGDVFVPSDDWIADIGIPTVGGQSAQDFFSIQFTGDVLIGEILSGFGFTSRFTPGLSTHTITYGAAGENIIGLVIGPDLASVPETGSTLLLTAISLAFLTIGAIRTSDNQRNC
jgi:hypothetical protein